MPNHATRLPGARLPSASLPVALVLTLALGACADDHSWNPTDGGHTCEPDGAERAVLDARVTNTTDRPLEVSVRWVLEGLTTIDETDLAGGPTVAPGEEAAFATKPDVKTGATIVFTFLVTDATGTHELEATVFADRSCPILFAISEDGELTVSGDWE